MAEQPETSVPQSYKEQGDNVALIAGTASGQAVAYPATLMLRTYYSSYHLWAAEHFTALAAGIEALPGAVPRFDIQHRAYVTSTIFSSVAFMEAAINEIFKDAADSQGEFIAPIDAGSRKMFKAFWDLAEDQNRSRFSALEKYQIALTFCRKDQFSNNYLGYQDAKLVIQLRNELMHYKPESFGGDVRHRFEKKLKHKFPENQLMSGSGNPYFPDKCLGSGCAEWAVKASKAFVDEFCAKLGISLNYQQVKF